MFKSPLRKARRAFWFCWAVLLRARVCCVFERVVGMERLVGVKQSLLLDGRKVCNIKRADISQAESNKATACVVPSIHLPLTREASLVRSKGNVAILRGKVRF